MAEIPVSGELPAEILKGGHFFTYALPWLLTFAIVYGFLQHYKVPKSLSARAVISIVLAFFVMPVAAPVMAFLQEIGASLIVIVTGIIFFLVLMELTGTKKTEPVKGEEGEFKGLRSERIIESHPKTFGAIVVIILVLVFWGSGGFEIAGLKGVIPEVSWVTLFFLGALAFAVWWLVSEEKGGK